MKLRWKLCTKFVVFVVHMGLDLDSLEEKNGQRSHGKKLHSFIYLLTYLVFSSF